jgi:hypothetical protein
LTEQIWDKNLKKYTQSSYAHWDSPSTSYFNDFGNSYHGNNLGLFEQLWDKNLKKYTQSSYAHLDSPSTSYFNDFGNNYYDTNSRGNLLSSDQLWDKYLQNYGNTFFNDINSNNFYTNLYDSFSETNSPVYIDGKPLKVWENELKGNLKSSKTFYDVVKSIDKYQKDLINFFITDPELSKLRDNPWLTIDGQPLLAIGVPISAWPIIGPWMEYQETKSYKNIAEIGLDLFSFAPIGIIGKVGTVFKDTIKIEKITQYNSKISKVIDLVKNEPKIFTHGAQHELGFIYKEVYVGILADTQIADKTLALKNVVIEAAGTGEIKNLIGPRAFLQLTKEVGKQAKNQGFEKLIIEAERSLRSSSARKGHLIELEFDLTKQSFQ